MRLTAAGLSLSVCASEHYGCRQPPRPSMSVRSHLAQTSHRQRLSSRRICSSSSTVSRPRQPASCPQQRRQHSVSLCVARKATQWQSTATATPPRSTLAPTLAPTLSALPLSPTHRSLNRRAKRGSVMLRTCSSSSRAPLVLRRRRCPILGRFSPAFHDFFVHLSFNSCKLRVGRLVVAVLVVLEMHLVVDGVTNQEKTEDRSNEGLAGEVS